MYVDNWITGRETREEKLLVYHHTKNIKKEPGMELRVISNDTILISQWAAEGFDTYPVIYLSAWDQTRQKFIFSCKNQGIKKKGPLTSEEMMEAEYFLLKQELLRSFHTKIIAMQNGDDVCHKS
ncbi:hypothetical protein NPIL_205491 [Nephila pilipes]|uniref:Uncharacterized protein n=1 Tax=Nephila pilipes TaxID=299642 RepID=A0A8X6M5I7_NEPPI|nr:hypothetical protein NPIL_205491 [Nephila pilipes]